MKNLKKKVLLLIAVVMTAALAGVMSVSAATETLLFADFTDTTVENLPMHNPNAGNNGGRIKKDTTIYYEGATQSGLWSVTGSSSSLNGYYVSDSGIDLTKAGEFPYFVIRFYSSTDNDAFNVLFYNDKSAYYKHEVFVTKSGWQEAYISVADIEKTIKISELEYFCVQKGGWNIVHPNKWTEGRVAFNPENFIYFDSIYFEKTIFDVEPMRDNQLLTVDFSNRNYESLPMNNTVDARNDNDRIRKNTEIYYGESGQSGLWTVTGSNSRLVNYYVSDAGLDVNKAAKQKNFVMRLYASTDNDAFGILFYNTAGKYYHHPVTITKAGWQKIEIPLSLIETKIKVSELSHIVMQKGGWGIVHPNKVVNATDVPFNPQNALYFDRFWFETPLNSAVFDADDSSLAIVDKNGNCNDAKVTEVHFDESQSSLRWYHSGATIRSLQTVNLADVGIDSKKADKVTFRMYSESYDEIVLLAYYTDPADGKQKYVHMVYYFGEDYDNVGKWVEAELDISGIKNFDIDFIGLTINGWGAVHNTENNIYFDKIWIGEKEELTPVFGYKASEFDKRDDVEIFDTISFKFDEHLAATVPCDGVIVKRDGNKVTEFKAWTERNQLFVKTDAAMKFDSSYEVTVTTALKDMFGANLEENKTVTFKTEKPYFAMDEVKLTDASGKALTALPAEGAQVKLSANVINGSDKDKSFVGIIAMYDGEGKLLKVYIGDKKTYDAGMVVQKAVEASGTVVENTAEISAFIWDGFDTMVPYVNPLGV